MYRAHPVQQQDAAVPAGEIRNQLARFLLRGASVDRAVGTLCGGERFRVISARLGLTTTLTLDATGALTEGAALF